MRSFSISEFKDRRLEEVCPTTFNKDLSFLKVVVDIAIFDWGISIPFNPCLNVKRLKQPRPRTRILEGDEHQRLIEACSLSNNKYLKSKKFKSKFTDIKKYKKI